MASTDDLLNKCAVRIGELTVTGDWLGLQLAETQAALEAVTLDRDQMHAKFNELRVERDALAARVREGEPESVPRPTPKVKPGAGLK